MSMKLSRRDRIIFIVGIVIIILVVGGLLAVKPKYEESQASQERLIAKETERDQLQQKIDTLPGLKAQLEKDVDSVLTKQQLFLEEKDYEESYEISMYLMDLLAESDLEVISTSLKDVEGMNLEPYVVHTNTAVYDLKAYSDIAHQLPDYFYYAYENNWPANPPAKAVATSQVTIGYRTELENFEGIYNAIDMIAECDKAIYLDTIGAELVTSDSLTSTEEVEPDQPYIEGEMVITVYELTYMNKDDIDKVTVPAAEETPVE
ncbi:MAG: hypothetical protein J6M07_02190 [Ruminococcus sp.]|nr:hypothetical protein [Ruminococcus sp.]